MSRRSLLYRRKLGQVGQVRLTNGKGGVYAREHNIPKDVNEALFRITRHDRWAMKDATVVSLVRTFSR